ncbi:bacteriohemerythrin [Sporosalibacterium faouarense]|uniref:bacteriohemerythrin n=1 Tax=Sporosalibacterium faouarense TaxID=516123 RepID=UPI00141D3E49|nr:bacteriohemerythrin [Sporosalibacterium faouarense]MTI46361.1 bacteriohemerythrin [Bacillota bacterium]
MAIRWKESYSCNIEAIDNQHKKLFEIGDELYTIVTLDDGLDHYDEINSILQKLKDYAIHHFNYEEELMGKYNYSELDEHRKQHDRFVNKVIELEHKDFDEDQKAISLKMVMFIADWIEKHILGTDFKYKEFFDKKGIN